ncbi:PDZ domain-containing protein [Telmatobacter bradus]|uniref:PDZ domain-containing protein n=1 Tax=Telmatobacter bradus TaxID=474953 RepID=UPI003B427AEC
MKHFLRPPQWGQARREARSRSLALLLMVGAVAASLPAHARAAVLLEEPQPALAAIGAVSPGYLGVELADVDAQRALALRLKDTHGAVITLIDHDAPAGQIGLKVNDVVLEINGTAVQNAEELRRVLRDVPAGRKISLLISRDGNTSTIAVELADRKTVEHDVWNKIDDSDSGAPAMNASENKGDFSFLGGFHLPFLGGSLNVGVLVEPLTSQMAEYLGVDKGLMVKQVAGKSAAAAAGLKAFDVILKVGTEPISNLSNWDRALRANQGKTIQVTILRDRKQQKISLQADSRHH